MRTKQQLIKDEQRIKQLEAMVQQYETGYQMQMTRAVMGAKTEIAKAVIEHHDGPLGATATKDLLEAADQIANWVLSGPKDEEE